MQIYYCQFERFSSPKQWGFYFQQMPEDIQERIRRYRKEENKYQLLFGRSLLKYGMADLGYRDFDLVNLYYDQYNCPKWNDEINFNIAHSGNLVACAFSEKNKIGIDIEKIRKINLKDFAHVLNEVDHQNIAKAENQYQAFFKIWTIKEAVTKAIGMGLSIDVQKITIVEDFALFENKKWFYQKLNFDENFAAHLVSNKNNFENLKNIAVQL